MTANDIPHDWPESLRELAFATGADAVNALLERWAGQRVYLRLQTLAPVVGELAAKKILRARGSGFFDVPKASSVYRRQRDAEIIERHGKGETISALAGASGLTPRALRRIIQAHRATATKDTTLTTTTTAAAPAAALIFDLYAHDNIHHDDRRYSAGDKLPPLEPAAAQALIASGVASHEPPPPPEPLPTAEELAAVPRGERASCMTPSLIDWLALQTDYRAAAGKPPLTDEQARDLREAWRREPAHEQANHFRQMTLKLRDAGRAGVTLIN